MRIYRRIYYSCESQEYAVKGVVVGSPFNLPTILAGIQNYRFPSATKGENILSYLCIDNTFHYWQQLSDLISLLNFFFVVCVLLNVVCPITSDDTQKVKFTKDKFKSCFHSYLPIADANGLPEVKVSTAKFCVFSGSKKNKNNQTATTKTQDKPFKEKKSVAN